MGVAYALFDPLSKRKVFPPFGEKKRPVFNIS